MSQAYVCGFAFKHPLEPFHDKVILILKLRGPDVVRNRYNGIGGKIEEGETPIQAMVREFEEEAGAKTNPEDWELFVVLNGPWGEVHFFRHFAELDGLRLSDDSPTDEFVTWRQLDEPKVVSNLRWLLPLALDREVTVPIRVEFP